MAGISPETWLFAILGGMVPTFLWLWFWMSEESDGDAPRGLLALAYIAGMVGVLLLLPMKGVVEGMHLDPNEITILYAALEEFIKVGIISLIAFGPRTINDASDYMIYLVTGALGFSALENTLYLINPIREMTDIGSIVITGNLRFLGATVLHTVTVGIVGVMIGLAYAGGRGARVIAGLFGIALGIGLHTVFNSFIMQDTRQTTTIAIAGIWFVAVIVIILFDRLRIMQFKLRQG